MVFKHLVQAEIVLYFGVASYIYRENQSFESVRRWVLFSQLEIELLVLIVCAIIGLPYRTFADNLENVKVTSGTVGLIVLVYGVLSFFVPTGANALNWVTVTYFFITVGKALSVIGLLLAVGKFVGELRTMF